MNHTSSENTHAHIYIYIHLCVCVWIFLGSAFSCFSWSPQCIFHRVSTENKPKTLEPFHIRQTSNTNVGESRSQLPYVSKPLVLWRKKLATKKKHAFFVWIKFSKLIKLKTRHLLSLIPSSMFQVFSVSSFWCLKLLKPYGNLSKIYNSGGKYGYIYI